MTAGQLKETTMDPATRTLLRVVLLADAVPRRRRRGFRSSSLMGTKAGSAFRVHPATRRNSPATSNAGRVTPRCRCRCELSSDWRLPRQSLFSR
ncbi:MAG: hypothetical protein MZV49_26005 [Rhodopseudomonas palustris]|nr:hypothetical protein [Rhodopseudomonas palustris]